MLMFDSARMPRLSPETAEKMNPTASTAMMPTITPLPSGPTPPTISTPRPICSAPMPSETAVPNRVTTIAKTSTTLPSTPSVRRPKIGSSSADISGERPLRYAAYATAPPTSA